MAVSIGSFQKELVSQYLGATGEQREPPYTETEIL